MLLIVDAPMYQRWQMMRSNGHPKRGVHWLGSSKGGKTLQTHREVAPCPQTQGQVTRALSPSDTENTFSPTVPIYPAASVGERPSRPLNSPVVSFLVPILMTLTPMAVVQAYGSLTIQAKDIINEGQWHRVQALMQGTPWGMLLPPSSPDLF